MNNYYYYNELPEMTVSRTYDEANKEMDLAAAKVTATASNTVVGTEGATVPSNIWCCRATNDYCVPRTVMYILLFWLCAIVLILSSLNVASPEMTEITQYYTGDNIVVANSFPAYRSRRVVVLTLFSSGDNCTYLTSNFTAAMDRAVYPGDTAVRPSHPIRVSGVLTLLVLILSAVLMGLSLFSLGCLIVQHRQQQRRQQLKQEESAAAARVRQAIGITSLVLVFVSLALTAAAIGTAVRGISDFNEAADMSSYYYDNVTAINSGPVLSNRAVWFHLPNLIFLFIMTVLLCVPILSGIADHPVAVSRRL